MLFKIKILFFKLKEKFLRWKIRVKQANQKRQAEYLYLSGRYRWRRFLLKIHPLTVWSFFTSKEGLWLVLKTTVGLIVLMIIGFSVLYFYYRRAVPATILELQSCPRGQATEFYTADGKKLIWTFRPGSECQQVSLQKISPYLLDAVITSEDEEFYEHSGYKLKAIGRALINNLRGRPIQGGSTITQQYIKNAILKDSTRSLERKIKEIILVPEIESTYSKDEILNAYLNTAYFGEVYDGVEAAAQGYFNKSALDLTLDESALLVSAMPGPVLYWNNPKLHLQRRNNLLKRMYEKKQITQREYQTALKTDTFSKISKRQNKSLKDIVAPYFVLSAQKQLAQIVCQSTEEISCPVMEEKGYKVITTLDLKTQNVLEESIYKSLADIEKQSLNNSGLVAIDTKTGQVLGMQGGRDFNHPSFGQINHLTNLKTPNQTWQPIIYASLLNNNQAWGGGRTLYDYPTFNIPPQDYQGPVSLRQALGQTLLTPAIKAAYIAKSNNINALAKNLDLNFLSSCASNCHIAQALADDFKMNLTQLTNAYATFGRGGSHQTLSYIKAVDDLHGQKIYRWQPALQPTVKPETAYIINQVLSDRLYKINHLSIRQPLAFKNKISNDFKDNHFIAYTPQIAIGGWIGSDKSNQKIKTTSLAIQKLQTTLLNHFLKDYQPSLKDNLIWPKTSQIKSLRSNIRTGYVTSSGNHLDYYPRNFQKPNPSDKITLKIDKKTQKLANDCASKDQIQTSTVTPNFLNELPNKDPLYEVWAISTYLHLNNRRSQFILSDKLKSCS